LERNSDGLVELVLRDDDYVLLYAYDPAGGAAESLVNPNVAKVWFKSAPLAVWPKETAYPVEVGYSTDGAELDLTVSLEWVGKRGAAGALPRNYAKAPAVAVRDLGTNRVEIVIPEADLGDPNFVSSADGGEYVFKAWLSRAGLTVSETTLPVRLLWGIRPFGKPLPENVTAPGQFEVDLEWQELPSLEPRSSWPLSRADLWDSLEANDERYEIVLELKQRSGQVVGSDRHVTSEASGVHRFHVAAASVFAGTGPFTWSTVIRPVTGVESRDFFDGFEGRMLGARYEVETGVYHEVSPIAPWASYRYPDMVVLLNEGLQLGGREGSQSMFLVATNPPSASPFFGFGVEYTFPREWPLPTQAGEWRQWKFGCDFRELSTNRCLVELQLKNANDLQGGQHLIHYVKPYDPAAGTNRWNRIEATLDQFVQPGHSGLFDPSKVRSIVINVQILDTSALYVSHIDNVKLDGPDRALASGPPFSFYFADNDSFRIGGIERLSNGRVRISWTGNAALEVAGRIDGPWTVVSGSGSPHDAVPSQDQQYFRLRK
jgi:hypothetical protein